MALIQCYECSKEISDKAPACPHCGAPKEEQEAPAEQSPMSSELKALAGRNPKLKEAIHTLRDEGFPDQQIPDELFKRGYSIPGRLLNTARKHKDSDGQVEGKEATPSLQEILAERERGTVEPSPTKKTAFTSSVQQTSKGTFTGKMAGTPQQGSGVGTCKKCGGKMAFTANSCPHCGGQNWSWILIWAVALPAFLLIIWYLVTVG